MKVYFWELCYADNDSDGSYNPWYRIAAFDSTKVAYTVNDVQYALGKRLIAALIARGRNVIRL